MDPKHMRVMIEESLDLDKASDIVTIDLQKHLAIADFMIVATGTSSRHVSALAGKIRDRLKGSGVEDVKIEGLGQCNWVIVDAGDIIVHIFRSEVREFYNIETNNMIRGVPAA